MRDRRSRLGWAALPLALAACSVPPLKPYAYPAWGFAVSFRAAPAVTPTAAAADGSTPTTFEVRVDQAGRSYVVYAMDAAKSPKTDQQLLSDAPLDLANEAQGNLTNLTYVATGPVVGRAARVEKAGETVEQFRIFVWRRRLYEVVAATPLGADDPLVTEFLDSFRFVAG